MIQKLEESVKTDPGSRPSNILRLLNYDFASRTSQRIRHVFYQPLGVLVVAALVSLACGLFLHAQAFSLGGCLLAIVMLGTAWPRFCSMGINGTISYGSGRVVENQPVVVHLELTNHLPWPVHGLFIRNSDFDADDASRGVSTIPAKSIARCSWEWVPCRRGVYPSGPMTARTGFPFGLWVAQKDLRCPVKLTVWPETYPVGPMPRLGPDDTAEGSITTGKSGNNGEFSGARPFRRGDHQRRIHWALTARHDRLIVRELETPTRPTALIFVDNGAACVPEFGNELTLDWQVRVAASLASGWLEEGAQVGLIWHGGIVEASSGTMQKAKLMDAAATISRAATNATKLSWGDRPGGSLLKILVTSEPGYRALRESAGFIENHRSVVLGQGTAGAARTPWLRIASPDELRPILMAGWMEARHGS